MNLKKIIATLSFLILLNCGYEPIYSKKQINSNYNFSINTINLIGDNKVNQILKNKLKKILNKEKKTISCEEIIKLSEGLKVLGKKESVKIFLSRFLGLNDNFSFLEIIFA